MIDMNKSLKKILKDNNAEEFEKYLMYTPSLMGKMMLSASPETILKGAKTWSREGMNLGLHLIEKTANSNTRCIYPLYFAEECKDDKQKKDVVIMRFPVDKKSPYIVVCAGGGYTAVCSLAEGFPTAARFNELGYNVFLLNYRIGGTGVLLKPLDDLAKAVRFIEDNAEEFNVEKGNYVVCGFSAGGNLTTLWGTENVGYKKYGLPKPKALFPIYPAIGGGLFEEESRKKFAETMFGKNPSKEIIDKYDAYLHLFNYPPCYIVACEDDDTVPFTQSVALSEKLNELSIKNVLDLGKRGGHGFGEGSGTDAAGWTSRAIEFFESL